MNRKIHFPSSGWLDVNTAASETEKWENYTIQVYITGKTMASFYKEDSAFSGNLWMVYVHLKYEFEEVRPTSLSVMSTKDADTAGTKIVTMPSTSDTPGALALEVASSSALGRTLMSANALTTGQTNAIWEIGDMAVTVASNFLGPFGWILQGGWFVIKKHFGKPAGNATAGYYLIYPSLVQAQQDNYVTAAPGQDVATVTGKVSVQQLTNPNFSGDASTSFGSGGIPLGYPLYLPYTSDQPPILATQPGKSTVLARTHPDIQVLPLNQTAVTYNWKFEYRLNSTSWENFPVNAQQRGAFPSTEVDMFDGIVGTETVVMNTTVPTSDTVSYSALWRGTLRDLVAKQVKENAHTWRGVSGQNQFLGTMFPFYETATTWSAGRQFVFGACWLFVGYKSKDTAPNWMAMFVLPGDLKWQAGLSPGWTMHDGFMGPTVMVINNAKRDPKTTLRAQMEELRLKLDELDVEEDSDDDDEIDSDVELVFSDGEGGVFTETYENETGERFIMHKGKDGHIMSISRLNAV